MLCPSCGEEDNQVIHTDHATDENVILRVRLCRACGYPWATIELPRETKKDAGLYD
jgi:transcriptional regulator NrdR family protein